MSASYWNQVLADGLTVPEDRPLGDLTAELTRMLGDPDPGRRDEIALLTLTAWIERGVYDDLLVGLGDGMSEGLRVGVEAPGTDDVFRRSCSALVLARCLERANAHGLVGQPTILDWGDRLATWLLREQDLRSLVEGKGWAHAVARGADAIGALGGSPHLSAPELTVLLDVLADRVLAEPLPGQPPLDHGELDRLAIATLQPAASRPAAADGARALGQPDRGRRDRGDGRACGPGPLPPLEPRRGLPARALRAARTDQPTARRPGRPGAGGGRRAASHQPRVPGLSTVSVTCVT